MHYTSTTPDERCTCCGQHFDELDRTYRRCRYCYETCPAMGAHVDPFDEFARRDLTDRLGIDDDTAREVVANTYGGGR